MLRRDHLVALAMALVAIGCGSEQDRIEKALESAFADALVGCVPLAWEQTTEPPPRRTGSCFLGRRGQDNFPATLDVLSNTNRVRLVGVMENVPKLRRYFGPDPILAANQYELVEGYPIVTIEASYSTTTAMCWADARVQIVDINQDRMWKWDHFYDVAAAAGIDTLRIARLRKPHLSADVWYRMEVVPRPWVAQLEPAHLAILK